jgi:hypothetical protein
MVEHARGTEHAAPARPAPEPAPAAPAPQQGLLSLQHSAGNAAVVAMLGAQAKLVVGAADDPYEREADDVARQVMQRLTTDDVTLDPQGAIGVTRRQAEHDHGDAGGPEGGAVTADLESRIARSRGGGQPLDAGTRTRMEGAFGADFSSVQVHVGPEADTLNRSMSAHAFTLGSDIWFGQGKYQPTSAPGQELLAHELTHVAQQSTGVARKYGVIQRHASWEHRMLGDVDPAQLRVIVESRDQARADRENAKKPAKKPALVGGGEGEEEPLVELEMPGEDNIEQATHVLQTQMAVLQAMRTDGTLTNQTDAIAKARAKLGLPNAPETTLVPVGLSDGTWDVVTYGEINTLADYYGSEDEIAKTVPGNFRAIVKGLRERQLRGWAQLLAEVEGRTKKEIDAARNSDDHKFEGAIGDSGRYSSDRAELQLMGKLSGAMAKTSLPDAPETGYVAGLARNACHFAPYSWHAWADHHNKAIALATQAHGLRQQAANYVVRVGEEDACEAEKAELLAQADDLLNKALIVNGFGDHFLQDSFASGHLINKTLVMKWFAIYLDQHKWDQDFATDTTWRGVQATVYGQEGAFGEDLYDSAVSEPSTDPQSAENLEGSWKDRFEALGLAIPRSLRDPAGAPAQLLKSWQTLASTKGKTTRTIKELTTLTGLDATALKDAVLALVQDSVVYRESRHREWVKDESLDGDMSQIGKAQDQDHGEYHDKDSFSIRDTYVPPKPPPVKKGAVAPEAAPESQDAYDDKVKATAHQDYQTFLNRSYLQFATNVLHNKFCEDGLSVKSGADGELFKVYGDNAMLDAGAAAGVEYSAQTARRSISAIKLWATEGAVPATHTVDAIAARFPNRVEFDGTETTIKDWHAEGGPLQKLCTTKIFPSIAKTKNAKSSAVGAGGSLADVVSKDVKVHSGADF